MLDAKSPTTEILLIPPQFIPPFKKCCDNQISNFLSWKFFQMLPTEDLLGNWSGPPDQSESEDDDQDFISFSSADAEYFARANLNSLEDVGAAIEACKNNILETTENTSSRKSMVNRLIQLQIRQEDLKEKNQVCTVTET